MTLETDIQKTQQAFGQRYIALRKKEGRIYTDAEVGELPFVPATHIHYAEWQIRRRSAERLVRYLKEKKQQLSILEVGCGNGWLSGMLSGIPGSEITATDINIAELEQAKKVFSGKKNISFIAGDIRNLIFHRKFDVIVFAASVQYFSSFEEIMTKAMSLLNEKGEIHILDSFFYKKNEIENARQRTMIYYQSMGSGEMAQFYFHHDIDSLKSFKHKILFDPQSLTNKLFNREDPFLWIRIKGQ